jgi:hypothetical protein
MLQTDGKETVKDKFEIYIFKENAKIKSIPYYKYDDKLLILEFNTSDTFYIYIDKTEKYNFSTSDILYIDLFYTTSSMNDENRIGLKKNDIKQSESFYIDIKKKK